MKEPLLISACLLGLRCRYDGRSVPLDAAALEQLSRFNVTKAFISAFGVSSAGVSTNHENHSTLLGKVLRISEQKYLLVDGSKFERNGLFRFAQKNQFDEIITD